jgi:hypothetical protein
MTRAVVPIANLARRLPEAGRIRTGVKRPTRNGKEAPSALSDFRFTSHDEDALERIAEMYGGTVKPWSDPKAAAGQFEVITEASEIRVVLPPDPLGGTPVYELWGGGGCERRCDGLTAQVLQQGPDGLENVETACLCAAKGEMSCQVTTRLNVIIPEVKFAGVWRLYTKSWNAAQELPGMVDMVQSMQTKGLAYALLGLQQKRSVQAGETRRFIVPVLGIPASIEQLAAGGSRLASLPSGSVAELESGPSGASEDPSLLVEAPDEEIHDAEIVEDPQPDVDGPALEPARVAAALAKADARERWKNSEFTKALAAEEIPLNESRWTQGQALRIVEIHAEMVGAS